MLLCLSAVTEILVMQVPSHLSRERLQSGSADAMSSTQTPSQYPSQELGLPEQHWCWHQNGDVSEKVAGSTIVTLALEQQNKQS